MDLICLRGAIPVNSPMHALDLCIEAGQHWVVTGPRASGKTLLAEVLVGQRRPAKGTIEFPFLKQSTDYAQRKQAIRLVTFMDNSRLARNPTNVHYYQQRYNAFDASGHPTVRQYLEVGGYRVAEHADVIEAFGIGDLLDVEKIKLSSGQTRKVLLARELLRRPRVLVIDNPYVGLDVQSRRVLNDLLDQLVARLALTLILCGNVEELPACITHRLDLARDGRWRQGENGKLASEPSAVSIDRSALEHLRNLWQSPTPGGEEKEIIRLRDVSIRYGDRTVLDRLSWHVLAGEKWVVSGPNGSGKSTLLSLVYADNPLAYANEVYLFGSRRGRGGSIWEIKKQIGFTSPELHTYFREPISAREVVLTGYSDTFTLPKQFAEAQLDMVDSLLRYFDLNSEADKLFLQLSDGTQRLVLLCRALVKAPPLLLLDEPFQGLDRAAILRARSLLQTVLCPQDTVLFISHFRPEVPEGMEWRELRLGTNHR